MDFNRLWTLAVAVFLVAMVFLSAFSRSVPIAIYAVQGLSALLLVLGLMRLLPGLPSRQAAYGLFILLFGIALIASQLVPLPPDVWQAMPGRAMITESFAASGVNAGWMPLSLAPRQTTKVLSAILPAVAIFVATLSLDRKHLKYVALLLLVIGTGNAILGLAQKFQGSAGGLLWSTNAVPGTTSGMVANRNHFAALMYVMIPLLVALGVGLWRSRRVNGFISAAFTLAMASVFIIGLGASGSRAGIILAMVAVVFSAFLAAGGNAGSSRVGATSKWLVGIIAIAFFIIAQFGLVAVLRLAETDPVNDYRNIIADVSWQTMVEMLPFGSGFGSFVETYQMFERPSTMVAGYINQAHNDWLEIAIEGGLPAIFGLLCFSLWFVVSNFKLWRHANSSPEDLILRAAGISAFLLLAHSLVDYPLRAPLIMVWFGFFCGLVALGPSALQISRRKFRSESPQEVAKRAVAMPVTAPIEPRKGPFFIKKEPQLPENS